MPIYEYKCSACGHQLEALQKFSDAPLVECPECGKPRLQKLISSAAFQLKGSGWYVTDFRDKDKKKASGAGQGDKGDKGEKGEKGGAKTGQDKPQGKTTAES